jgi:hypothetical protein
MRASPSRTAGPRLLALWLVASIAASAAAAQDSPPPREGWSEAENWAWDRISAGEVADFNKRDGGLDPKEPDGWGGERTLRPGFLKTILLREPYLSSIPVEGVRIVGAHFPEAVDLAHGRLDRQLRLEKCRFAVAIDLTGLRVDGWLSLEGSAFEEAAYLTSFYFEGMKGSVNLEGAEVKGSIDLGGANVAGALLMNGLEVGQNLLMSRARLDEVRLAGARVGGQLNLFGATVAGTLVMEGLAVGEDLFMGHATLRQQVHLIFSRIGSALDLSGAQFGPGLDLSATRVAGELRLGSGRTGYYPAPMWHPGAHLVLRNAHAGVLQDRPDAWEGLELQLDGFTYGRLGGYSPPRGWSPSGSGAESDMLARDIDWYRGWLARDPSYAPQPYEQLAAVFRVAGEPAKADDILYESRERARKEAADLWRWLGLNLSWLTIGYGLGLGYFRTLWWVLCFTLLGTAVLVWHGQGPERLSAKAFFSLDRLLPRLLELDKTHDKVEARLTGSARCYFYLHRMIGFVLAGFLLAGLAGLTQE